MSEHSQEEQASVHNQTPRQAVRESEMNEKSQSASVEPPQPDTHCWDDDEQMDVWSYSHELLIQYGEACAKAARKAHADEIDKLRNENERLRKTYRKMRNSAAGYSNLCEETASAKRCDRDYAEAEDLFRSPPIMEGGSPHSMAEAIRACLGDQAVLESAIDAAHEALKVLSAELERSCSGRPTHNSRYVHVNAAPSGQEE